MAEWVDREVGLELDGIDLSDKANYTYRLLNPSVSDKNFRIPIPGNEFLRKNSVKEIMDEYEDTLDNRKNIFLPAYSYHVINNALPEIELDLDAKFFDYSNTSKDIENMDLPYSHSSLLVDIINLMGEAPILPFNKEMFRNMDDQMYRTKKFRDHLSKEKKFLFDEIISFAYLFAPRERNEFLREFKSGFALRFMHATGIERFERVKNYTPSPREKAYHRMNL